MKIKPKDFAKTLYALREQDGKTVRDMAKALGQSDSPRSWARYEDDDSKPTLLQAEKLLKALGYTLTLTITKR